MRSVAADWLKAAAIVAVVVTHSGPPSFHRARFTEIDHLIRVTLVGFHVPVFLLVSGYLAASRSPLTAGTIGARLLRVLVPYGVASLVMTLLASASAETLQWQLARGLQTWHALPRNLAIGNARGIYYFVPLWVFCTLSGWLWSRIPRHTAAALVAVFVASLGRCFLPSGGWTWDLRDPLLQAAFIYYLIGWCARLERWDAPILTHGRLAIGAAFLLALPWWFAGSDPAMGLALPLRFITRVAYAVAVTVLIVSVAPRPNRAVMWLATMTLPIFLYHEPLTAAFAYSPKLLALPPFVRITLTATLTLGVTVAALLAATRFLPPRVLPLLGIRPDAASTKPDGSPTSS